MSHIAHVTTGAIVVEEVLGLVVNTKTNCGVKKDMFMHNYHMDEP